MGDNLINPEELGKRLGISPFAVRTLCEKGHIPGAKRLGRFWTIPDEPGIGEDRPGVGRPRTVAE